MKPAPKVLRRGEWGWPTKPVHLEVLSEVVPETDRPPLLFLHGGGQTRHAWGRTAQDMARKGAVTISLDQRGHGDSEWATRTGGWSSDEITCNTSCT